MLKKEYEMIYAYYYGISKMPIIWKTELDHMIKNKQIAKVYEMIDTEYNETWYYIRDIKENSYIMKSRIGRDYGYRIIEKYKNDISIYKIGAEIIHIIEKHVFPIVVKVKQSNFYKYYDINKNINNFFFNNYYCEIDNMYYGVRSYRNRVEYTSFNTELDVIKWCNNLEDSSLVKKDKDLLENVYNDIN